MVSRKTSPKIKKEILEFLFEGPKSINELKEKIGSNWPTINSYLEKLKEEKRVNEILITNKMKVYRRTDDPVYYSLPFNKNIRTKTLYILSEIEKKWKKEKETELSKTALQKLAVDVIRTFKLDLPILNFHYGMTTCASLDSNNNEIIELIKEPEEKEIILKGINEIFKDKKHTGIAHQEKTYQYEKYNMPFYSAKENLAKLFIVSKKNKTNKEFKEKLKKALLNLSLNYPMNLEGFYLDFEKFIGSVQIILSKDNKEDTDDLDIIKGTLTQLWDKLTTFTSFQDAERFIEKDKKQLFEQIKELNYNFKELNYKIYIEELESLAQEIDPFKINMPQNETSDEIQKLILEGLGDE